ncbi:hypothetical protein CANARDRAFT_27485 [[Candida] arabinofermentans NRRL YB-2248]|uniref:Glutamyl-tRNA(Gln) amidotransferase subunit B, mitochondrial n=1 Tax=[Candida] arabinofermentans NRRL YB-2248 TaxID=983967 RepID=A0A1E4T3B7_9ASCO|nr:hypothetical protein CANARDRAFT_27485 [[Candida] arabinofermentans NRRL YB-2248]
MSLNRKLKIGLEIHTQLKTTAKLFSLSPNSTSNLSTKPNSTTSFFDVSLPGTQPKLNKEALLLALKVAVALNCNVASVSSFDRKHYFYGDQPLGYQITQHYKPIAKDGYFKLSKRYDNIPEDKTIRIEQLQIEQDTGRSLYRSNHSNIDFNRSNIPLIELVTKPDFTSTLEVKQFIKKFQTTLQLFDICTGELETGTIRVDVNVSVDDHPRVEVKNVPTTSGIANALKYEYSRQSKILDDLSESDLKNLSVETRGWDGKTTYKLRSKESSVDYRYVPDMELPLIKLNVDEIIPRIKDSLPPTVDQRLEELIGGYGLKLRDALVLLNDGDMLQYYKELVESCRSHGLKLNPINWLVHEMAGALTKSGMTFTSQLLTIDSFVQLLAVIENGKITIGNGKLLLLHLINNKEDQVKSIESLISEFELGKNNDGIDIDSIVTKVLEENGKVVDQIVKKGKKGKLNYLIGLCMRVSEGSVDAGVFEKKLKEILEL